VSIPVEGVATDFVTVATDEAWAAVADTNGVRITVIARGVAPEAVRLERVAYPAQLSPRLA